MKKQTNEKSIPADDKASIAWEIGDVISGFKGILGGESKGGCIKEGDEYKKSETRQRLIFVPHKNRQKTWV